MISMTGHTRWSRLGIQKSSIARAPTPISNAPNRFMRRCRKSFSRSSSTRRSSPLRKRGAHAGNESEQQRDQWRFLFHAPGLIKGMTSGARVPPQGLDPGYDAILAVGRPLDAMVAGRAERTFAGAASRACCVSWMEDAVHLGVHLSLRFGRLRRVSRFG